MSSPPRARYKGAELRSVYDLLDVMRERPGMWIGEPDVTRPFLFLDGFGSAMTMVGADYSDGEQPFHGDAYRASPGR